MNIHNARNRDETKTGSQDETCVNIFQQIHCENPKDDLRQGNPQQHRTGLERQIAFDACEITRKNNNYRQEHKAKED